MKKEPLRKTIIFNNGLNCIQRGTILQKLGAGVDGEVFRYDNIAIKLLKGTISERRIKNLMSFDKALYFKDKLSLIRITQPIDILFDEDGIYTGYVMKFLQDITINQSHPLYRNPSDFKCGDLLEAMEDLSVDFANLSRHRVRAVDINYGSYIYTSDFIHLCDMDKYQIFSSSVDKENQDALYYTIAKFIGLEMRKTLESEEAKDNQIKKEINGYVKQSTHNYHYFDNITKEIGNNFNTPLSEYIEHTKTKVLKS